MCVHKQLCHDDTHRKIRRTHRFDLGRLWAQMQSFQAHTFAMPQTILHFQIFKPWCIHTFAVRSVPLHIHVYSNTDYTAHMKQICMGNLLLSEEGRKHQSLTVDAVILRLLLERLLPGIIPAKKPQKRCRGSPACETIHVSLSTCCVCLCLLFRMNICVCIYSILSRYIHACMHAYTESYHVQLAPQNVHPDRPEFWDKLVELIEVAEQRMVHSVGREQFCGACFLVQGQLACTHEWAG